MSQNITLLEMIAKHLNLPYLSDLHSLKRADAHQAITMYSMLSRVQPNEFKLVDWNDALAYIAGLDPVDSPEDARNALLDYFSKKK